MIGIDGKKISISFEIGNYAIDYHDCEENFYDMVVQFQDENDLNELIAKLLSLKETYLENKSK